MLENTVMHMLLSILRLQRSIVRGVKANKGTVWFRFFQMHQIWHRGPQCHRVYIFAGRQTGLPMGPPYWQNPAWPPSA